MVAAAGFETRSSFSCLQKSFFPKDSIKTMQFVQQAIIMAEEGNFFSARIKTPYNMAAATMFSGANVPTYAIRGTASCITHLINLEGYLALQALQKDMAAATQSLFFLVCGVVLSVSSFFYPSLVSAVRPMPLEENPEPITAHQTSSSSSLEFYQQWNRQLQQDILRRDEDIQRQNEELSRLQEVNQRLEQEQITLREEQGRRQEEARRVVQQQQRQNEEYRKLQEDYQEAVENGQHLQQLLQEKEALIQKAEEELKNVRSSLENTEGRKKEKQELQNQLKKAQELLQQKEQQLQNLNKQASSESEKLTQLQQHLQQAQAEKSRLQTALKEKDQEIKNLEAQNKQFNEELGNLADSSNKLIQLQKKCDKERSEYKETLEKKDKTIQSLEEQLQQLKKQASDEKQLQELRTEVDRSRRELKEKEEEIQKLKQESNASKFAAVQDISQKKAKKHEEQNAVLTIQVENLKKQLEDKKTVASAQEKELSIANQKLAVYQCQIQAWKKISEASHQTQHKHKSRKKKSKKEVEFSQGAQNIGQENAEILGLILNHLQNFAHKEGIWRTGGDIEEARKLIQELSNASTPMQDKQQKISQIENSELLTTVVKQMIKGYAPLFSTKLSFDLKQDKENICMSFVTLPEHSQRFIGQILKLFQKIITKGESNKMSLNNLALAASPTFFSNIDPSVKQDLMTIAEYPKKLTIEIICKPREFGIPLWD
ncbi:MAG: hypothetical protein Tsb0015_07890 [Simkaniaceae bacterium]